MKKLEEYVVSIPDYPEKGIIFRDVTSILEDPEGLQLSIRELQDKLEGMDFNIVIGPESRGFIFGMPIAYNLQKKHLCRFVKKESFLARQHRSSMIWNMEVQRSRSTSVRSNRETRL